MRKEWSREIHFNGRGLETMPKVLGDSLLIEVFSDTSLDFLDNPLFRALLSEMQKLLPRYRRTNRERHSNFEHDVLYYYFHDIEGATSFKEINTALKSMGFGFYTSQKEASNAKRRIQKFVIDDMEHFSTSRPDKEAFIKQQILDKALETLRSQR